MAGRRLFLFIVRYECEKCKKYVYRTVLVQRFVFLTFKWMRNVKRQTRIAFWILRLEYLLSLQSSILFSFLRISRFNTMLITLNVALNRHRSSLQEEICIILLAREPGAYKYMVSYVMYKKNHNILKTKFDRFQINL